MKVSLLIIYCEGWAFCAFETVIPPMAEDTLRMICFSYVYSLITNGIILGGGGGFTPKIFFF